MGCLAIHPEVIGHVCQSVLANVFDTDRGISPSCFSASHHVPSFA